MTESKGVRAADDLMRKLVQVPAAEVAKQADPKRKKRRKSKK